MEPFDFSEDEIREQLELLGYRDIPPERLQEFKKDLEQLVQHEQSQSGNDSSDAASTLADGDHMNTKAKQPSTFSHDQKQTQQHSQQILQQHQVPPAIRFSQPPVQIPTDGPEHALSLDSTLDISSDSRRVIKRKVLRKVDGQSQIFDESSVTESDTDEMSGLEQRLRQLPVGGYRAPRPSTAPTEHRSKWHTRPASPTASEPVYRLSEDYEGPKALIRPMCKEPHKQRLHKCDPVARYQKYRSNWRNQKAPGERAHSDLRWSVREHMLYHDQVITTKQRPVSVPNEYQVPSDKKRKALRWQVRHDLAQGLLPPSILD